MTQIEFLFFGPPCFRVNGTAVKINRRKAVALAAYLAVTAKPHTREKLATMFWPESASARSRASLRKALSLITKVLGKSWLNIDRETIGFVPHKSLRVDVNRFLELAAVLSQDKGGEKPDIPKQIKSLEEAAQICKPSFLAGFFLKDAPDFEDWQMAQSERLRRRAAKVLEYLTRSGMSQGAYSRALSHARQLAALDPLDEGAQRLLIHLYAETGQPGVAVRQYEKYKTLLKKELGVLPGDETRALGKRIRETGRNEDFKSTPARSRLPAQSTRFVGRKDEIKALAERMAAPEVRLLTLTGQGGIGKTRLALELAATLMDCFPHGVFFVEMAGLRSTNELTGELLKALGLASDKKTGLEGQIVNFLGHRKILLVMDNFEHLPQAGGLVLDLLTQAPSLKILATSRTRLMLEGEHLSASGLADEVLDAHKHHYLDLARKNEHGLIGEAMLTCRRRMDAEFGNIRQAWQRAVDQKDLSALLRAAKGVYIYFDMHTRYHESRSLFQPAKALVMEMVRTKPCPDMALILLCRLDMTAKQRLTARQSSELKEMASKCLRLAVKGKNRSGRAFSLLLMGAVAQKEKAWNKAVRLFGLSLKAYPGIEQAFWVTVRMGLCWQAQGQMDKAMEYFRQGHKAGIEAGDEIKKAWTLCNIGICEVGQGNLESSQPRLQAAADAFGRIRAPLGMMAAYEELSLIALLKGNLAGAEALADLALNISKDLGLSLSRFRNTLALKSVISIASGHPDLAATFLIRAQENGQPFFMAGLGMTFLACLKKDPASAKFHLEAAADTLPLVHKPHLNLLHRLARAWVLVVDGQDMQAAKTLDLICNHPLNPSGLFRVWDLPGQLLCQLKSKMDPTDMEQRPADRDNPH